ncbi:MAG: tetratricopeptide repeat protein [Bacteroidia bacterium]
MKKTIIILNLILLYACNSNEIKETEIVRIGNPFLKGKGKTIDSLKNLSNKEAVNGNLKRADELSYEIYQLDSTNAYSLSRLGFSELIKGEGKKALDFINKSIKYDSIKEFSHNIAFKACAFNELENNDSADYYFKKMPDYNKQGAVDLWQVLICLNANMKFDKMIEYNNILLKYYPYDSFANINKANILVNDTRYNEALVIYDKIKGEENRSPYFYASRGSCYMYLKQYDKALSDMTKAHEMEPSNAQYIMGIGRVNQKMGNYKESEKNYKISMAKGDTVAVRLYNTLLEEMRQKKK